MSPSSNVWHRELAPVDVDSIDCRCSFLSGTQVIIRVGLLLLTAVHSGYVAKTPFGS